MDTPEQQPEQESPAPVKSVSANILDEFFAVLGKETGFVEITPRLRKLILDDGVFAEPAIRAALFPDAP